MSFYKFLRKLKNQSESPESLKFSAEYYLLGNFIDDFLFYFF